MLLAVLLLIVEEVERDMHSGHDWRWMSLVRTHTPNLIVTRSQRTNYDYKSIITCYFSPFQLDFDCFHSYL